MSGGFFESAWAGLSPEAKRLFLERERIRALDDNAYHRNYTEAAMGERADALCERCHVAVIDKGTVLCEPCLAACRIEWNPPGASLTEAAMAERDGEREERERLAMWMEMNVAVALDECDGTEENAEMMARFARVSALLRSRTQPVGEPIAWMVEKYLEGLGGWVRHDAYTSELGARMGAAKLKTMETRILPLRAAPSTPAGSTEEALPVTEVGSVIANAPGRASVIVKSAGVLYASPQPASVDVEALQRLAAEIPTRVTAGEWDGPMVAEMIRAALTRGHPWMLGTQKAND